MFYSVIFNNNSDGFYFGGVDFMLVVVLGSWYILFYWNFRLLFERVFLILFWVDVEIEGIRVRFFSYIVSGWYS